MIKRSNALSTQASTSNSPLPHPPCHKLRRQDAVSTVGLVLIRVSETDGLCFTVLITPQSTKRSSRCVAFAFGTYEVFAFLPTLFNVNYVEEH